MLAPKASQDTQTSTMEARKLQKFWRNDFYDALLDEAVQCTCHLALILRSLYMLP